MVAMMAITTPQLVINELLGAVEVTVGTRGLPVLDGTELDHVGFWASSEHFPTLAHRFVTELLEPSSIMRTMSITGGAQRAGSDISWYWGNRIAGLAVAWEPGCPDGGAYVYVTTPSLSPAQRALRNIGFHIVSLNGHQCLRVGLRTRDYGVGPGVYRLYVGTESLLGLKDGS